MASQRSREVLPMDSMMVVRSCDRSRVAAKSLSRGRQPTEGVETHIKPRSGDTRMSPLRGLQMRSLACRGLTPTAKLYRRCAAEEIHYGAAIVTGNKNSPFPRREGAGVICPRSLNESRVRYILLRRLLDGIPADESEDA